MGLRILERSSRMAAPPAPKAAYGIGDGESSWTVSYPRGDGGAVDERSKLSIGTFFNCIDNKSQDIAKLPFKILQTTVENGLSVRRPIPYERLNKIWTQQFNPACTAYLGKWTMISHIEGWGNAFAFREFNSQGQEVELWIIHPSRVKMKPQKDMTLRYEIRNDNGTMDEYGPDRILHLYGASPNGLWGYSRVDLMRRTLGFACVGQDYINNFFRNGAKPSGTLESDNTIEKRARENLKKEWQQSYGGAGNAGNTVVLDDGLKYKAMGAMSIVDQQFLELMQLSDVQIARAFRMPLHKIQIEARAKGYATLSATETDYVSSCLVPLTVNLEQQIKLQQMPDTVDDPDIWPHFEFKGLLIADPELRMAFGQYLLNIGLPPNRILCDIEDMEPVDNPAMDKSYMQGAMMPIEKLGQQPAGSAAGSLPSGDKTNHGQLNRIAELVNGNGAH